jgi:hypothetical protein
LNNHVDLWFKYVLFAVCMDNTLVYVHYHNLFCILFCSFEYGVVGWHDLYLAGWVARSILADKLIHTTMCCNCFCHILVKHAVFVFCCVQGRQALRRDRQPASHPASSPVSQSPATAAPSSQSAIHSAISQPASHLECRHWQPGMTTQYPGDP